MSSHSVLSNSLLPHGPLQTTRLLCPWDFLGKNTGVGSHFLLQGIFLTQGSNPSPLLWQVDSLPMSHLGSPARSRPYTEQGSAGHKFQVMKDLGWF